MVNNANGNSRFVTLGSLSIDMADIYAVRKYSEDTSNLLSQDPPVPALRVFTRLRESGKRDPLLTFVLHGTSAQDAWELLERIQRDVPKPFAFERYGDWYMRPDRVRVVHREGDGSLYTVFVSPVDGDGGWVTKLDLDAKAGQALDAWLQGASSSRNPL